MPIPCRRNGRTRRSLLGASLSVRGSRNVFRISLLTASHRPAALFTPGKPYFFPIKAFNVRIIPPPRLPCQAFSQISINGRRRRWGLPGPPFGIVVFRTVYRKTPCLIGRIPARILHWRVPSFGHQTPAKGTRSLNSQWSLLKLYIQKFPCSLGSLRHSSATGGCLRSPLWNPVFRPSGGETILISITVTYV